MLVGLIKAIIRIILSAVLNLFYLSRLDTALTVKGWEWLDKGTYVYNNGMWSFSFFLFLKHMSLTCLF